VHVLDAESATTATASSPESAASRRQPSPVTDSATGAVPMPSLRPTEIVRSTFRSSRSITAIRSWWVIATYARGRFGSIAIPSGCERCGPTRMSLIFSPASRSITDTVPSVSFETRPRRPSRVIAAPYG
jgi:hypothetical protein